MTLDRHFRPPAGTFVADRQLAWCRHQALQDLVRADLPGRLPAVRAAWDSMEKRVFENQPSLEKDALSRWQRDPDSARTFLTDYCARLAADADREALRLLGALQAGTPNVAQDKMLLVDKQQPPKARAAAAGRLRIAQINDAGVNGLPDLLKAVKSEPDHDTRVAIINATIGIVLHYKLACPTEFVDLLFDPDPDIRWLASTYVACSGRRNMYGSPAAKRFPR